MSESPYRRGRRGVAASSLGASALGVLLVAAPATAHTECDADTDVRVVVDEGPLGGGVAVRCVKEGGGRSAAEVLQMADVQVTWVRGREEGVVCRLDGRPVEQSCVDAPPADSFWGLFWTDADNGSWTYVREEADSLQLSGGSTVGWRFQDGGELEEPAHVLKQLPGLDELGPGEADPPDESPEDQGPEGTRGNATLVGLLLITGLCVAGFMAVRRRP